MTVEQKCRNSSLNKDDKEGKDRKIKVFKSEKENNGEEIHEERKQRKRPSYCPK